MKHRFKKPGAGSQNATDAGLKLIKSGVTAAALQDASAFRTIVFGYHRGIVAEVWERREVVETAK